MLLVVLGQIGAGTANLDACHYCREGKAAKGNYRSYPIERRSSESAFYEQWQSEAAG